MQVRNQWEYSHATRFVLQLIWFGALLISVFVDTPKLCSPHPSAGKLKYQQWAKKFLRSLKKTRPMYHFITRQIVKRAFADLSSGRYEQHLQRFHPEAKLTVAGSSETRGTYQSIDAIRKAFEKLYDYLPKHQFNLREIWIRGNFWNTRVAVAWIDNATDRIGESVTRQGMNFIRIQWGKVVEEEIYWTSN